MSKTAARLNYRKRAKEVLAKLVENETHVIIIHYSCESFYDTVVSTAPRVIAVRATSPRTTSIAVRFLESAQTRSFSIHEEAEMSGVAFKDISNHYDELEKRMLERFFSFAERYSNNTWVHWNMRDANYGFVALENRFKVLQGKPYEIRDEKKVDLARMLADKYSLKYIGHPRFTKLIEKNGITKKDFLTGQEEADAFENKDYIRLHQSTLRKVDIMETIIKRAAADDLETDATWKDIYGVTVQGVYDMVRDSIWWSILMFVLGAAIGGIIESKANAWYDSLTSSGKEQTIKVDSTSVKPK